MGLLKSRATLILLFCAALAGGFAVRALSAGGTGGNMPRAGSPASNAATASLRDGSVAKFAFLSRQTSNRCNLEPGSLMAMPDAARLQGSCCFPMNLAAYHSQVRELRGYQAYEEIPRDPYDIPVSLAKRLVSYDRTTGLSGQQAVTYSRAMRMSHTKGPCCCRCWRWNAFRGMIKHLIVDHRWQPDELARVIDLVEGCGGA